MLNGLFVVCIEIILVASCFADATAWPGLFASAPLQGLRRSYKSVRPTAPLRFSRLGDLAARASPLTSERLVPAVPCNRPHPLHALSTPAATRSNNQVPNGFVPEENYAPGFYDIRIRNDASSKGLLSFVSRMHTCASYPRAFPPTHTTTAFDRSSLEAV